MAQAADTWPPRKRGWRLRDSSWTFKLTEQRKKAVLINPKWRLKLHTVESLLEKLGIGRVMSKTIWRVLKRTDFLKLFCRTFNVKGEIAQQRRSRSVCAYFKQRQLLVTQNIIYCTVKGERERERGGWRSRRHMVRQLAPLDDLSNDRSQYLGVL